MGGAPVRAGGYQAPMPLLHTWITLLSLARGPGTGAVDMPWLSAMPLGLACHLPPLILHDQQYLGVLTGQKPAPGRDVSFGSL